MGRRVGHGASPGMGMKCSPPAAEGQRGGNAGVGARSARGAKSTAPRRVRKNMKYSSLLGWLEGRRFFADFRSEEHTSELQSLMRNSYAVFCLKKKTAQKNWNTQTENIQACTSRILV